MIKYPAFRRIRPSGSLLGLHPAMRSLSLAFFVLIPCAFPAIGQSAVDAYNKIEPFLDRNCVDCHDDVDTKGGLNILDLAYKPNDPNNFDTWQHIFDRVKHGEMPPKKKKSQPKTGEKKAFLADLEQSLMSVDRKLVETVGRVQGRRLSRAEYEHTIHDLIGIRIPLADQLAPGESDKTFDTVADAQSVSHFHMKKYLEAADMALNEAFSRIENGDTTYKKNFSPQELSKRTGGAYRGPQVVNGKTAFWAARVQFAGRMFPTRVPKDGWYKVTIHNLKGVNPGPDGAVWASLRTGQNNSSSPIQHYQASIEATPKAKDYTYTFWMDQGHNLELKPNESSNKIPKGDFQKGGRLNYGDRDYQKEGYAGLIYDSITMERVYPGGDHLHLMKRLYPGVKIVNGKPEIQKSETSVRKLVARFAWNAYRRPVNIDRLAPYQKLATEEFRRSRDFNKALHAGYRAVLCSPRFLTLVEKPGKLDDHAIASRLSYFLWSSMPDWELRRAADAGELNTPEQIRAQVERMLKHRKAERFVENFTDQWLMLSEIGFTTPDPRRFRLFDPILQDSMLLETRTFFRTLLVEDKSVRNFIKSDFGFLNTRLATHYGMKESGIQVGQGLQRVPLKSGQRNGLVTQGAILKVTADGSVTSPVIRGVFVGERILGLHIPPPPENVPAIEPDIRGAKSIRDQLEKHRESISCSSCHEKIDPAGFALEAFDPIGSWRKFYGQPNKSAQVDSSGLTLDGKKFRGIFEWQSIQANKPEQLARAFAEQLIAYSTGAKARFSDRPELQKIVTAAKENNYGVRSIIAEVAVSDMFLNK